MSPYFAQTKLYIKLKTNKKGVANSEWSQIFRLYNKFSKFPNNNHWSSFAKGGLTVLSNQSNIICLLVLLSLKYRSRQYYESKVLYKTEVAWFSLFCISPKTGFLYIKTSWHWV